MEDLSEASYSPHQSQSTLSLAAGRFCSYVAQLRIQKIQQHANITLAGPLREDDPLLRENEQRASQHITSCLAMGFGGEMRVTPARAGSAEADSGRHSQAATAGPGKDSPFPVDLEDAFDGGGHRVAGVDKPITSTRTKERPTKLRERPTLNFGELEDAFDGGSPMSNGFRKTSSPRKMSPPRKLTFYVRGAWASPRRPAAPTKTRPQKQQKRRRLAAWED